MVLFRVRHVSLMQLVFSCQGSIRHHGNQIIVGNVDTYRGESFDDRPPEPAKNAAQSHPWIALALGAAYGRASRLMGGFLIGPSLRLTWYKVTGEPAWEKTKKGPGLKGGGGGGGNMRSKGLVYTRDRGRPDRW